MICVKCYLGDQDGRGAWRMWGRREMCKELRWADLKERDYLEDEEVYGRDKQKLVLTKYDMSA